MAKSASISMTSHTRARASVIGCALASLALAGCTSGAGGGDWSHIYELVHQSWTGGAGTITLQQAAAVPYASLGVRVGGGPQTLVVLGADQSGHLLWTSAAKIAIETDNGRVMRTAGFPGDLSNVGFSGDDPLLAFERGGTGPQQATRTMDFRDINVFGIPVSCTLAREGSETIQILGTDIQTQRIGENCVSAKLDWQFENTFWMGTSGFIWKSVQNIHPKQDPLTIEVLRPPG